MLSIRFHAHLGFKSKFSGWNESLTNPSLWANSNYKAGDLMMGLYGGLYAYSGWDILNYGTGEIYRPRRYVLSHNLESHFKFVSFGPPNRWLLRLSVLDLVVYAR